MRPPHTMVLALALPLLVLGCETGDDGDVGADAAEDSSGDSGEGTETDGGDGDGDTNGDGDGDTNGDGDGDTNDTGEGDAIAQAACAAFASDARQDVIAAASAGEAATSTIVPDGQVVYLVTLPEGAAGYISLEIADWETTQAFMTVEDIDYTVTVESNSQVPQPREQNAACPEAGVTDQRIFFPHWTPATIEFSATGPREVPLMVIQQ